jgi:1-acyl-sn-glycerol-3-phosphate acyltransferase
MDKPAQSLATSVSDAKVVAGVLLALVAKVNHELRPNDTTLPTPSLDHHFDRDYGLDSLARVELIARIEKEFSTSLPEQAMAEAQSPRDILRALLKSAGGNAALQSIELVAVSAAIVTSTPENAETLLEVLRWHVEQHPDRAHIQFYDDYTDGEIITYGGLWESARAVAGGLQRRGLEPGESVALMLPTGKDYFFAFYGVVLAGAIPVPIYPPVRRAQLEDHLRRQSSILRNCRASMLITLTAAKSVGHLLTAQVDSLRHISTVDDLTDLAAECEIVERRAQDIGFLQYTSGSTGDPKGVILTHANLVANIRGNGRALAVTAHDVFVSWLPLYHDMGLIGAWLGSLYHAPRLVIMPPLSFLSKPERWLRAIHRYGGTVSAAPNFAFELCLRRINDEDIDGVDLSRWRLIANGAEAISAATMTAFSARFAAYGLPPNAVFPVYGLAESSVGLTFSPVGRGVRIDRVDRNTLAVAGRAKPVPAETPESVSRTVVSCGLPLPRHEIRVMDESNREVPERHIGRLQFRGPSATSGYYRNPQSTAGLIRDDWLESGDIAYIAAGELFVVGRHKDLIIRAGRNIYPTELEDRIGDLDGIRSGCVAVIGSPDVGSGTERLVVLAETRKQQAAARDRLRSEINELVTDIITAPPDDIILVAPNTILKTSSGKIRRADCCRLYEEGRLERSDRAVWLQIVRLVVAGVRPQFRRVTRWITMTAYAGYSWLVFSTVGIAAWVLAMLPLPRATLWSMLNLATRGLRLATLTRLEIVGEFPRSGQACVFVANHQSYIDGPTMLAALPYPVSFLVKGELQQSSLFRRPLLQLGVRFIERFDNDQGIAQMADAVACLQNSDPLFVFPEGTFKRMPGVLPFRMGAFTSAVAANVPVVPIAIQGSRSILRAGSWFPRRGRIKLTIGEAFSPSHYDSEWASALALRDYARAHILEHCDEPDLAHESNVVDQRS